MAKTKIIAPTPELDGFLRVRQILALIPVSKTQIYAWITSGILPPATKVSPKIAVWKVSTIRALIDRIDRGEVLDGTLGCAK
ncbi:MAG: AlpA family phage regulatory protein [Edaphobacter sp.]|nr:AlpA family phage regulatory protein [Edaphobacter sp.]